MTVAKAQPTTLEAPLAASDTSFTLSSLVDSKGNPLALSAFGSWVVVVLVQGSTTEMIKCSGVTQNADGSALMTVASSGRNIDPTSPYAGYATGNDFQSGAVAIVTNDPLTMSRFANLDNNQTFSGNNIFTQKLGVGAVTSSDLGKAATVDLLNATAVSGAPNASPTVKGIVQEATQAQVVARTAAGSTGADLYVNPSTLPSTLLSDYQADTGAANAYAITPSPAITAYTTGQIFSFKAANTNTLTSTLAVNGLAAKTIQRSGSNLGAGDIVAGQIYIVEYDGTQFQLLNVTNSMPPGAMQMYAGASAPTGWLLCDGTSYLQATYPILFAIIGTTYGSADGTHFNVPDMRGRVPLGVGTGTGGGASGTGIPSGGSALTAVARGTWKGEETHTLTTTEMPSHTHSTTIGINPASGSGNTDTNTVSAGGVPPATGSAGSVGSQNNIQQILGVQFIIKT